MKLAAIQKKLDNLIHDYMYEGITDEVFMNAWLRIGMCSVMLRHSRHNLLSFMRRYKGDRFSAYARTGTHLLLHYVHNG